MQAFSSLLSGIDFLSALSYYAANVISKVEKLLSYLDKEGKDIIFMGDINCDLLN